jgi:predicted nicotinamide N-methyase
MCAESKHVRQKTRKVKEAVVAKTISFANVQVVLTEDFENDTANGTRLWEAGMLLARYIEATLATEVGKTVLSFWTSLTCFSIR